MDAVTESAELPRKHFYNVFNARKSRFIVQEMVECKSTEEYQATRCCCRSGLVRNDECLERNDDEHFASLLQADDKNCRR